MTRGRWALATLVLGATSLSLAGEARAGESTLWRRAHAYPIEQRDVQARAWYTASGDMYDACEGGESAQRALGRARVPNRFLRSAKFLASHWDHVQRMLGYDSTCAIAQKFTSVGLAIGIIGKFCGGIIRCPTGFTVIERGTKEALRWRPDICRWRIGFGGEPRARDVISTPCR